MIEIGTVEIVNAQIIILFVVGIDGPTGLIVELVLIHNNLENAIKML